MYHQVHGSSSIQLRVKAIKPGTVIFGKSCYFQLCIGPVTSHDSTDRRSDFIKCLNFSFKPACLQCSFTDKELEEYIQFRKCKASKLPSKYAVQQVGLQSDALWVMGSDTHLSQAGEILDVESSKYIWIG